jgi:hypothetical protein
MMAMIMRWLSFPAAKFGLGVSSRKPGSGGGVVGGTDTMLINATDVLMINGTDSFLF